MRNVTRSFDVLRLSITSRCNLHCTYCRPRGGQDQSSIARKTPSAAELMRRVERLLKLLPLKEVHITGGEPTLHPELLTVVRELKGVGIPSVALTTNGTCASTLIGDLPGAGLDRLNISLDAMDEPTLALVSGHALPSRSPSSQAGLLSRIQRNIETAVKGPCQVKINTTILRGVNDMQILPVFEWARGLGIPVRYLELMRMGPVRDAHDGLFVPMKEILATIGSQYRLIPVMRETSATAREFETSDGYRFGIIANHSSPFCSDCNRLRMDSSGRLYGCISSERGIEFPGETRPGKGEPDRALEGCLNAAMLEKKSRFEGCATSMQRIGG